MPIVSVTKIIGDIPIYVSYNSVDVWINQNLFKLDKYIKMCFPGLDA